MHKQGADDSNPISAQKTANHICGHEVVVRLADCLIS